MAAKLNLHVLEDLYAVCQLEATASIPAWALGEGFLSISRSEEELTVVCLQNRVPPEVKAERNWRCLGLAGPFDFALTGILASVLNPLAKAGVGIFAVSTYNTDYVLLKHHQLEQAVAALEQAGHVVHAVALKP
ncbi:MAG: ACT domain-containing protein [Meiothermus sp.]|uniref:ACT domain-containing protein n=1 Tax=Meiothermus sp. TaxID=1955249 RepID=UPI0025E8FEAD|nr:ACT domain-containing protein [Meiothermus sp.]MCS7067020.1 ACT domain-containing protein [Meiothermus sp.]MCX7600712.1 ACT domain-containing protein [Meiothermus sp.]MDW8425683.1 ACT domain-containing protein [Meiothermus sp.]